MYFSLFFIILFVKTSAFPQDKITGIQIVLLDTIEISSC